MIAAGAERWRRRVCRIGRRYVPVTAGMLDRNLSWMSLWPQWWAPNANAAKERVEAP